MVLLKIFCLSFCFGVTNKLADLMNEHGLNWGRPLNILMGFIWGFLGALLVIQSTTLAVSYISLVLYWFLMLKLDYHNHAIAGVIILISGFYTGCSLSIVEISILTSTYFILGILNNSLKNRSPTIDNILRLRLKIYLVPLAFSIYAGDFLPFYTTVLGMIGVELITFYFSRKGIK
jgi:hypothetical protein